jgi:hypothetical protein
VAAFPGELDYQTGLGWALQRMGKREEAVKLFRGVLAVSPDNPNALLGMDARQACRGAGKNLNPGFARPMLWP